MIATQADPTQLLRVLADPTRLRALALLELEELSVGDLGRCLGMAQSRVSNHLRVLRENGLLIERHLGTRNLLRSALTDSSAGAEGSPGPWPVQLWMSLRQGLPSLAEHSADRMRLDELLSERRAAAPDFFDGLAGEWDKRGAAFDSGQARQRTIANLLGGGLVLADLGCGTGYMARAMAPFCRKLICVDGSVGMIDEARRRLATLAGDIETEFLTGALDALPIEDNALDGAVAGMVLHHLPTYSGLLREMRRVIRPGGTAVVLELAPHREAWMSAELGDRHLGLDPAEVSAGFRRAGFETISTEAVDDSYRPVPRDAEEAPASLSLYIVRGRVPQSR